MKSPSFNFYPDNFIGATTLFTNEQVGKYIRLLCLQFQEGRLTKQDMLTICGSYDKRVFSKFEIDDEGLYYNVRLEHEITKKANHSKKQKENVEKRWYKDGIYQTDTKPIPKDEKNNDFGNTSGNTFMKLKLNTDIDNDNEIESEIEDKPNIRNIVDYLNSKAGTKYKHTSQVSQRHINARINDGYKMGDFVTVIDKKCDEWLDTEMAIYLRPETLFGSKFDGYLNQPVKTRKQEQKSSNPFLEMLKEEGEQYEQNGDFEAYGSIESSIPRLLQSNE